MDISERKIEMGGEWKIEMGKRKIEMNERKTEM